MNSYILPYTRVDGIPTFKDSDLMEMFDKVERDGTVGAIFFDGSVKTRQEFATMMKQPGVRFFGVYVHSSTTPVGFIWLDMFMQKTARGHFCAFSEYWGDAYKIGHEVLVQLLTMKDKEGNYVLDAIYGFTPEDNELALAALQAAGFRVAGVLPNAFYYESDKESHAGVMMYYNRDEIPEEELV